MTLSEEINLVTGAFSYSGKYIADELLKYDHKIKTLTGHPDEESINFDKIDIFPYNFENYSELVTSLTGVTTFINTYWIRFPQKDITWDDVVSNSKILFDACKEAGVKKIIHLSVTNPSLNSPYPYFKGKAEVEDYLTSLDISYTIIRPALTFEDGDILLNNIAWLLRRSPLFGIFGDGKFMIQPISQLDLSKVVVSHIYDGKDTREIIDAIGPETHEFQDIIKMLNSATNSKTLILKFPGVLYWIPYLFSKIVGFFMKDTLLTRNEIGALKDNLLLTNSLPVADTSFKDWVSKNGDKLGSEYAHEINRHYE